MAIQYGWSEQTPAVRNTLTRAMGRTGTTTRRRKRKAKKAAPAVRRVKRKAKKAKKFAKGSAAAKRHMAKLRRMRKR